MGDATIGWGLLGRGAHGRRRSRKEAFKSDGRLGMGAMMSEWCAGGHKDMEETSLRYTATAPRQCSGFVMHGGLLQPCECGCHSGTVLRGR